MLRKQLVGGTVAKLILHIGMVKTGSSAIQASLAAGSGNDFIYPRLGGVGFRPEDGSPFKRHHTDSLIKLFSSKRERFTKKRSGFGKAIYTCDSDEESIRQAAANAGDGYVILSSEALYSYLKRPDVEALRAFAENLFDDVRVVAYVREPYSLISASFWTRIKGSRLARFEPMYRRYKQLKKFDTLFGRDRVSLWAYDRTAFPDGNVVQHFCANLGLRGVPSLNPKNVTLSRPAVSAIYRLNRALAQEPGVVDAHKSARIAVADGFPHVDWPKFRLSPHVLEPLIEAERDDINWIEKRLGCSLRPKVQPQPTDVTCEADLLEIDPRALETLVAIGERLPEGPRELLLKALAA